MNIKLSAKNEAGVREEQLIGAIPTSVLLDRAGELISRIREARDMLDRQFSNFEKALYGVEIDQASYRDDLKQAPPVLAVIAFELAVRGEQNLANDLAEEYADITGRDGILTIPTAALRSRRRIPNVLADDEEMPF